MEKWLEFIGKESSFYWTPRKDLKSKKEQIGKQPPPPEKVYFPTWRADREKILKAEMAQIWSNIIDHAFRDVQSIYSLDGFRERVEAILALERAKVAPIRAEMEDLDTIHEGMEKKARSEALRDFENRFAQINAEIVKAEARIPGSFEATKINSELFHYGSESWIRFPMEGKENDRVRQEGKRFCDLWVTRALKSKKSIYFDDADYIEKLIQVYEDAYLVEFRREEEEKKAAPPPPVEEKFVFSKDIVNPQAAAISEFHRMGDPVRGEPGLSWTKQRLYRGGTKS